MSWEDLADPVWITIAFSVVIPLLTYLLSCESSQESGVSKSKTNIPWAPGKIPLLGHAFSYRKDPSGFLLRTCQSVGSCFQLNLAGKHMIIVVGADAQRQIAKAPERVLSARQAVADIGFEVTLGSLNVYQGTDLHKGIVKGIWQHHATEQLNGWKTTMQQSLQREVAGLSHGPCDFFRFIRRVVLRATIDRMISHQFLMDVESHNKNKNQGNGFLDQFVDFQDHLEDVTAKALVLPRWIAGPALLTPVRRKREQLQESITKRLNELIEIAAPMGFWLAQMHPRYSTKDIAEYMVGLLFVAHGNPAIGSAQAYLMLHEHCSKEERDLVQQDAKTILNLADASWGPSRNDWNREDTYLRRLCLETLRLTAHSIGAVRTVQEDFTIEVPGDDSSTRKYTLPKGSSVGLTHITPSLNPQSWGPDASNFSLKAHSMESYRDEYKFTTFSNGVHKCPGQRLAVVMLQLTVAFLLEDYVIDLPFKIPPISFERPTLAQREGPVMVKIQRRQPS